jgi:hypothetical protein
LQNEAAQTDANEESGGDGVNKERFSKTTVVNGDGGLG